MSMGITVNYSMVREDDNQYTAGLHYSDTNGIDIDLLDDDTDFANLMENMCGDFLDEFASQYDELLLKQKEKEEIKKESDEEAEKDLYVTQLEKIIEDLTYENNSLKTDVEILQRRADDAVNKRMNSKGHKTDLLDSYLNQFLKFLY